jgi:gag-polypeptide of LTR copia-type
MSISTSSTRTNSSIKPLRGKENYMTWSIEIENILLRNNNVAYIRNGSRAARPRTRYLDDYNRQLAQYDRDLVAYNAAVAAFEAAERRGRAPIRIALPKKPDEAKGEEKELKIWEEKRANALTDVIESIHYTLRPSIKNYQSSVETLLEYCKTLYGSIGQNERMRAYSNLNSIRLSSCGSLQQYIIRFNNAFEELTRTGATLPYGLILF